VPGVETVQLVPAVITAGEVGHVPPDEPFFVQNDRKFV
jgi:hypothetical protein